MSRFTGKLWSSYLNILNKHPMKVQVVQKGVIMVLGDVIAQLYLEKVSLRQLDIHRSAKFGLIGMTFVAPTVRIWYLSMEKMLGSSVTLANTFRKVGIDQLGFAPLLTAGILAYIGKLQGQSSSDIKVKLKKELKSIVITGWKIWPTVQIVNFYFVPFLVRPLVVGAIALIWNTYLAWKTRPMQNSQFEGTFELKTSCT